MYNITNYLADDEMTKLIVLASADDNYVTLDITRTNAEGEEGYSVVALVFNGDDTCIEAFYPTNEFPTPHVPYLLSHVIRAELDCRQLNCDWGVSTSVFDEEWNTQKDGVPYLCEHHMTYETVCESVGYQKETLH